MISPFREFLTDSMPYSLSWVAHAIDQMFMCFSLIFPQVDPELKTDRLC